jgi:hypothetical protein
VQHIHGQARALERLGDTFGQLQMVFDQQDTHGFYLVRVVDATLARSLQPHRPVKPETRNQLKG